MRHACIVHISHTAASGRLRPSTKILHVCLNSDDFSLLCSVVVVVLLNFFHAFLFFEIFFFYLFLLFFLYLFYFLLLTFILLLNFLMIFLLFLFFLTRCFVTAVALVVPCVLVIVVFLYTYIFFWTTLFRTGNLLDCSNAPPLSTPYCCCCCCCCWSASQPNQRIHTTHTHKHTPLHTRTAIMNTS